MSSSDTITPSATSHSTTSTVNLFPTTTTNSVNSGLNQGNPTTYYFVVSNARLAPFFDPKMSINQSLTCSS